MNRKCLLNFSPVFGSIETRQLFKIQARAELDLQDWEGGSPKWAAPDTFKKGHMVNQALW